MLSPASVMEMLGVGEQTRVEEETRQGTAMDVVVASVDGELIPFVGGRMDDWHSSTTGKMGIAHSSAPGEKQRVRGETLAPEMGTGRRDWREIVTRRETASRRRDVGTRDGDWEERQERDRHRERNNELEERRRHRRWGMRAEAGREIGTERRRHRRWGLGGETGERSAPGEKQRVGGETSSPEMGTGRRGGERDQHREMSAPKMGTGRRDERENNTGRETASQRRDVGTGDGDWEERRGERSTQRDVGTGDGDWEERWERDRHRERNSESGREIGTERRRHRRWGLGGETGERSAPGEKQRVGGETSAPKMGNGSRGGERRRKCESEGGSGIPSWQECFRSPSSLQQVT